jgi:hypothetical protein
VGNSKVASKTRPGGMKIRRDQAKVVVARDRCLTPDYAVDQTKSNKGCSGGPRPVLRMEQVPSSCTESDKLVLLLLLCFW